MPQIRPITDFRNTGEISELCNSQNEPIFITKNGYGDLVVMSIEVYDNLIREREIDNEIQFSEIEYEKTGYSQDVREFITSLRKKNG